jgi:hypothetical protein
MINPKIYSLRGGCFGILVHTLLPSPTSGLVLIPQNGPILNPDSLLYTNVFKSMAGGGYPTQYLYHSGNNQIIFGQICRFFSKLSPHNVESIRDSEI